MPEPAAPFTALLPALLAACDRDGLRFAGVLISDAPRGSLLLATDGVGMLAVHMLGELTPGWVSRPVLLDAYRSGAGTVPLDPRPCPLAVASVGVDTMIGAGCRDPDLWDDPRGGARTQAWLVGTLQRWLGVVELLHDPSTAVLWTRSADPLAAVHWRVERVRSDLREHVREVELAIMPARWDL